VLVLKDGRRWAEAATDFQRADAVAILEPRALAVVGLVVHGGWRTIGNIDRASGKFRPSTDPHA
jgi:hypothetical protein